LELLCKNPKIRVSEIRVSACVLFSADCIVSLFLLLSISIARSFLEFVHGILISNTGSNNRRFGLFWRFGFDFLEGGRRNLEDADLLVAGAGGGGGGGGG